jgi:hypothetical protein
MICEYVSSVKLMLAWPSRALALGLGVVGETLASQPYLGAPATVGTLVDRPLVACTVPCHVGLPAERPAHAKARAVLPL